MINNIIDLFKSLFTSCISFEEILLLLSAIALLSVVVTVFKFVLKGRY